jgi:hypothetical protein
LVKGELPDSLLRLTFGYSFNQIVAKGVLPASLTQLTFGSQFNKQLRKGVLPASIKQLTFGSQFNKQLRKGVLPASIKQLNLDSNFTRALTNLPRSLLKLTYTDHVNRITHTFDKRLDADAHEDPDDDQVSFHDMCDRGRKKILE